MAMILQHFLHCLPRRDFLAEESENNPCGALFRANEDRERQPGNLTFVSVAKRLPPSLVFVGNAPVNCRSRSYVPFLVRHRLTKPLGIFPSLLSLSPNLMYPGGGNAVGNRKRKGQEQLLEFWFEIFLVAVCVYV